MRLVICLLAAAVVAAVETQPVRVLRVIDGGTIEVQADLGGQPHPVRVRLLYVDTPEAGDNQHGKAMAEGKAAKEYLESIAKGRAVILRGPGERLERDQHGRVLAIVEVNDGAHDDLSSLLIVSGHSVYWRKYGDAPGDLHAQLQRCQEEARQAAVGAWATAPQWMQDKANERTAPKAGTP